MKVSWCWCAMHVIWLVVENQHVACVDSRSPGTSSQFAGIALRATCRGRRKDGAMFAYEKLNNRGWSVAGLV